ncbi:MAG: choice-of-anchor L domain-containing protein [Bradymonadia bacterium]|jgi:hypothetical protein
MCVGKTTTCAPALSTCSHLRIESKMKLYSFFILLFSLLFINSCTQDTEVPGEELCGGEECAGLCCNEVCVNKDSNVNHCGACGKQCNVGESCSGGECVRHNCVAPLRLCSGRCVDYSSDEYNCGGCGRECASNMQCIAGQCYCKEGYINCDENIATGCESKIEYCECTPGTQRKCYDFAPETEGVGVCKAGTQTCIDGYYEFGCKGQVGPQREIPGNRLDDNCNGEVDEDEDLDGDGWTVGQGDCCDDWSCEAENPAAVNPGAYDFPGNNIDDDCDGIVDNAPSNICSTVAFAPNPDSVLGDAEALKLAQAMDICTNAEAKKWGLISAKLTLANGEELPTRVTGDTRVNMSTAEQIAVTTKFGDLIETKMNKTMAILSSGKAKGSENASLDDFVGTKVRAPEVFLAAHGGVLPALKECPPDNDEDKKTSAYDSIRLSLKMRAPTNARGIKFDFRFFSKEYPKFACGKFNDFFLALLDSEHPDIPADRNISFDVNKNPVSVNNAFFTSCKQQSCDKANFHTGLVTMNGNCPASLPCADNICGGKQSCPDGSSAVLAYTKDENQSGATAWLSTEAPVMPGEEFTIDFIIFDAGGHIKDSLVLLDNFDWKLEPTKVRTIVN